MAPGIGLEQLLPSVHQPTLLGQKFRAQAHFLQELEEYFLGADLEDVEDLRTDQ
jgi:hypothetical protein